jgi:hypothetical protein
VGFPSKAEQVEVDDSLDEYSTTFQPAFLFHLLHKLYKRGGDKLLDRKHSLPTAVNGIFPLAKIAIPPHKGSERMVLAFTSLDDQSAHGY